MKTATMVGLILTFCMLGGKSVPAQAAVSATGQTGQANEEIKIEDITGWVGLDPAENRSGGDAGTAWGYYGHYCSGTACTGTDEDEPDAYSIVT